MSFVNTNPDGSGANRWQLGDNDGRTVVRTQWTTLTNDVELTANDVSKDFVVPADEAWHIRHVRVYYVADSATGDRRITLEVIDGSSNVMVAVGITESMTAAETLDVLFANGMTDMAVTGGFAKVSMPDLILPTGYTLRIRDSLAADADDDMSVFLMYETMPVTPVA